MTDEINVLNNDKDITFVMISPNFPETYYKFAVALKERGVKVLGIGDAYPHELKPELREALTDYIQCYNMHDIHNLINLVGYYQYKYGHIDWLESNNEYWLAQDSVLREWFNIKSGIFHSDIIKYKAKSEMKKYFQKAGVKVAKYHLSDNFENVVKFAEEVGYPIFVKPNIGVGASGTQKIKNIKDLQDFFEYKDDHEYIFEQFIEGEIYSFDGITNSKGEIIFKDAERFLVNIDEMVHEDSDDAYFTFNKIPAQLNKIGERIVKSFELKSRCFHIELFRLTKDIEGLGKKGAFVGLEVNMRPPGGNTPDLISLSQNVSFYEMYADMIAYDKNLQDINKEKHFAMAACRKDRYFYKHSLNDIFKKYEKNIKSYGRYPKAISDAMGDEYFYAIFDTKVDALKFQKYVRDKKEK